MMIREFIKKQLIDFDNRINNHKKRIREIRLNSQCDYLECDEKNAIVKFHNKKISELNKSIWIDELLEIDNLENKDFYDDLDYMISLYKIDEYAIYNIYLALREMKVFNIMGLDAKHYYEIRIKLLKNILAVNKYEMFDFWHDAGYKLTDKINPEDLDEDSINQLLNNDEEDYENWGMFPLKPEQSLNKLIEHLEVGGIKTDDAESIAAFIGGRTRVPKGRDKRQSLISSINENKRKAFERYQKKLFPE